MRMDLYSSLGSLFRECRRSVRCIVMRFLKKLSSRKRFPASLKVIYPLVVAFLFSYEWDGLSPGVAPSPRRAVADSLDVSAMFAVPKVKILTRFDVTRGPVFFKCYRILIESVAEALIVCWIKKKTLFVSRQQIDVAFFDAFPKTGFLPFFTLLNWIFQNWKCPNWDHQWPINVLLFYV